LALKEAALKMMRHNPPELTISDWDLKRARKPDGAKTLPREVRDSAVKWVTRNTNAGQLVTLARARNVFSKLHNRAGGHPADLNLALRAALLKQALRGKLRPSPPEVNVLLNLFSGAQSADLPSRRLGYLPYHVDILEAIFPGDGTDQDPTKGRPCVASVTMDLAEELEEREDWLVKVCTALDIQEDSVRVVAAAINCQTYTVLDHCNRSAKRPTKSNYRCRNGLPTRQQGSRRDLAIKHDLMGKYMSDSMLRFLMRSAALGLQRHIVIENGLNSHLWSREFMQPLPDPRPLDLCMYRVRLDRVYRYPTPKATGISTTFQNWAAMRCDHRHEHTGTIGAASSRRPKAVGLTIHATKRFTPESLWTYILQCDPPEKTQNKKKFKRRHFVPYVSLEKLGGPQ
jgi:hypothetical protein